MECLEKSMKYHVYTTEYKITTYEVEAESVEEAFEEVAYGDNVKVLKVEYEGADEFGPPDNKAVPVGE